MVSMKSLKDLQKTVNQGLALIKQDEDLIEGVVYASSNHRTVGRICYTRHIPSNGLQEPKSDEDFGVSVEIWFEKSGKKILGFGQEPNDLSANGIFDTDETTVVFSFLTAMIEDKNAKGSAWKASAKLNAKDPYNVGKETTKD